MLRLNASSLLGLRSASQSTTSRLFVLHHIQDVVGCNGFKTTPIVLIQSHSLWQSCSTRGRMNSNRPSVAPSVHFRHFTVSKLWRSQEDKNGTKPPSRLAKTTAALKAALPSTSGVTKHENIHTIPNWLTLSRLVAAPFIGYCILHDHHAWALGLFAYAGVTDLLDGWIARKWNQGTVVGTIIDPMADKTLMTILTVTLATKGLLPVWLAVIILGRDVALAISALYFRWISLPPPKTMARYWDFSLPSAEVRPTAISKYNTALQLGLMGLTTVAPVVPALSLGTALMVMQYSVAVTTIWSGASYVYSKDAVKILTQPTPKAAGKEGNTEEEVDEVEAGAKKVKDETTKQR
ncbi:phosphatidyl synthase [Copromyces sp. CBS 386.78]|nr:phosphatidyl synthase [Copromyces sp. CBS 386.78]